MFKYLRRWMPVCIFVLILFTMLIPSFAESSDYQEHWASPQISKWVEKNIILGYPDGTFKPDKPITRADFATIISRIFCFEVKSDKTFPDVPEGAWYEDAVSKAVAAGVIEGDSAGKFNPEANITRQEAAVILYRAFHLKTGNVKTVNKYTDASSIASWSKDAVAAMTEKGYISGRPGNVFAPADNITRAEAVKMIDNITNELKNAEGTYTGDIAGNLVVNTEDVVLKDMVIYGDLILAQGIGSGTVTLENVVVNGRTVVLGGGEQSIILSNTNLRGTLVVIKYNGKVRIVAKGSTEASDILLNSGAKLEEDELTGTGFGDVEVMEIPEGQEIILEGDFEEVIVSAPGVGINVTDGSVGTLEIAEEATGATVNVSEAATVNTLTVNTATTITGAGKIKTANVNVNDVVMEQTPTVINVAEGIKTTVAGKTVSKSTDTTTTPSTGGGGGGGGKTTKNVEYSSPGIVKADGTKIGIDISGQFSTIRVKGIKFETNISEGQLKITQINSPKMNIVDIDRTITISSSAPVISVVDVIGTELAAGKQDISIGSMREIFGDRVTIKGTLLGTGTYKDYTSLSTTISISLGSDDPNAVHSKWAELTFDGNTVTAKLVADHYDDSVSGIGIETLIMNAAGTLPAKVGFTPTYGGDRWYTVSTQRSEIKGEIGIVTGISWQDLKVSDLDGMTMYFTKAGDTTNKVYTLNIEK